jgi:hypothetical protein
MMLALALVRRRRRQSVDDSERRLSVLAGR